jgi:hypothetical protein
MNDEVGTKVKKGWTGGCDKDGSDLNFLEVLGVFDPD